LKLAEQQPGGAAAGQPPQPHHELRPGYVAIGNALTSFGLHGEIKVEPLTPFSERFDRGAKLWFAGEERTVERSRFNERGVVIVKLSGIDTPEQVAPLRGEYLQIPEAERAALPEGEFYSDDLLGLTVRTTDGRELGAVVELLPTGANDVMVVRAGNDEQLIPLIADVVTAIDLAERSITIEPLPGLLNESPDPTLPPKRHFDPQLLRRQRRRKPRPAGPTTPSA
jgi:16S rRNA processing protein RimM